MAGLVVASLLVGSGTVAQAHDDAGVAGFFQQVFGGGDSGGASSQPVPQPTYAPGFGDSAEVPLTVRRKRIRHPSSAYMPVRPGNGGSTHRLSPEELAELKNVTIYTDKTLRAGDAVMTQGGMKIFIGSSAMPHRDSDFVAVADNDRMKADLRKQLTAMDVASRF